VVLDFRKNSVEMTGMLLPGSVPGHGEEGRVRRRLHPGKQARGVVRARRLCMGSAGHRRNDDSRNEDDCWESLN
jgi:hypothetical protein